LFNLARARLAKYTPDGAQALMNTDPAHWSRAWFKIGSNCDSVDNNMCETFNKWIVEARFFPIVTMLETIRRKVMVRIQQNRSKSQTWIGTVCPNILKKLNASITLSGVCHAISNGADRFEVNHWDNRFTVDLQARECSCRYWQLSGLPCCHAISCIFYNTNVLDDYIASCYHINEFNKTYSHCLNPLEGMQSWPESHLPPLKAPGYVRMPGRPKKERKREPQEQPKAKRLSKVGTVIRCRKCKGIGHNRSTCDKRHGVPSSSETPGGTGHAAPQPSNVSAAASTHGSFVPTATSNESSRGRGKRRASQRSQVTVCATAYILPHIAYILPPIAYILTHMQKNIKCTAIARV